MIVIDEQQMSQENYIGLMKYLEDTHTEYREGSLYTIQDNYRVEHIVYGGNYSEETLDLYGERTYNRVNQQVERGIIYDNGLQDKIEKEVAEVIHTYEAFDKYEIDELRTLLKDIENGEIKSKVGPSGYHEFEGANYVVVYNPRGHLEDYYAKEIGFLSNKLVEEELRILNRS